MRSLSWLLIGAALALAACEAPGPAPEATTTAPSLTRPGEQVVTLEIANGTGGTIIGLARVVEGRAGPNLMPAGQAIPPGGHFALPVAPGGYLLSAQLQPPGVFQPGRVVQRHVVVPRFPPNPPPRLPVTLR